MAKYRNTKCELNGIKFDSKAEMARYQELKLLERAGKITTVVLQPKFELIEKYEINGRKERAIKYIADFSYTDIETGEYVVEDVKGFETKDFKIKKKMFESKFGIELRLINLGR